MRHAAHVAKREGKWPNNAIMLLTSAQRGYTSQPLTSSAKANHIAKLAASRSGMYNPPTVDYL